MTPFDIKFFALLKERIEEMQADFPDKVSNAEDFAKVQREVGYRQALLDIIAIGDEIQDIMNKGD